VFKLCRARTISSTCSPAIRPRDITISTQIYHRFYSKDMSDLHGAFSLVVTIVRDIRTCVEQLSNAVAAVSVGAGGMIGVM